MVTLAGSHGNGRQEWVVKENHVCRSRAGSISSNRSRDHGRGSPLQTHASEKAVGSQKMAESVRTVHPEGWFAISRTFSSDWVGFVALVSDCDVADLVTSHDGFRSGQREIQCKDRIAECRYICCFKDRKRCCEIKDRQTLREGMWCTSNTASSPGGWVYRGKRT